MFIDRGGTHEGVAAKLFPRSSDGRSPTICSRLPGRSQECLRPWVTDLRIRKTAQRSANPANAVRLKPDGANTPAAAVQPSESKLS
jgi:hypothetical protein